MMTGMCWQAVVDFKIARNLYYKWRMGANKMILEPDLDRSSTGSMDMYACEREQLLTVWLNPVHSDI